MPTFFASNHLLQLTTMLNYSDLLNNQACLTILFVDQQIGASPYPRMHRTTRKLEPYGLLFTDELKRATRCKSSLP
jgi:hypothetical protein